MHFKQYDQQLLLHKYAILQNTQEKSHEKKTEGKKMKRQGERN